jgi:hypothetical protein
LAQAPHVCPSGFDLADITLVSTTSILLLIVLVVLVIGVAPSWPHSRRWGYAPSGTLGMILVVVLILALLRYI